MPTAIQAAASPRYGTRYQTLESLGGGGLALFEYAGMICWPFRARTFRAANVRAVAGATSRRGSQVAGECEGQSGREAGQPKMRQVGGSGHERRHHPDPRPRGQFAGLPGILAIDTP